MGSAKLHLSYGAGAASGFAVRKRKTIARKPHRDRQEDTLQREVCRAFLNPETIHSDLFSLIDALITKWRDGKARHYDPDINRKLKVEQVDDAGMEHIKQYLISFATNTQSVSLFGAALRCLGRFEDPSLVPLLQGWLNVYVRKAIAYQCAVEQLVNTLERCGESVNACQWDTTRPNQGHDAARAYLAERIGVLTI